MLPSTPPTRVAVEDVWPRVEDGRVPIRRVPGDSVEVYADVFADGTAGVRARLGWQLLGSRSWNYASLEPVGNDRWRGRFVVPSPGEYRYRVEGWVDPYLTWALMLGRRMAAGTAGAVDLDEGAEILRSEGRRIGGRDGRRLLARADEIQRAHGPPMDEGARLARDPDLEAVLAAHPDPRSIGRSPVTLSVTVDPASAQHSAWYELFPRSTGTPPGRPGTLRDVRARLPYVADLGFDVVYLAPIHPIGRTHRRGPNNTSPPPPGAPGSPWAIGSEEGGHTAIHPELGSLDEFRQLVADAKRLGLEVALDLALQCSPDHPWVREHPGWFARLPDGTIRPAENPPKKYDDIYPLDFATPDWRGLWTALKEVVEFWVDQGVRWFRVDNPHTKPFEFWRWMIAEVRGAHPDVMFLAEAFTRPKVMYRLATVGFTHSYTYFAWRTHRDELVDYFRELTTGAVGEFFRPHLWPNTPDILTEQFHRGERSVFLHRLVLAATLSSHYGIYGPAYELLEHVPLEAGKEEYRDSEKYEVRAWNLESPQSIAPEVRRINRIRQTHPALRVARELVFHGVDNGHLLAYSRRTDDGSDVILVVVNLDPERPQAGWTSLNLPELGILDGEAFDVHDLWTDERFRWRGPRNFVRLDPVAFPAHIFQVERPSAGG
jgi:starch synthase (maltosyl-transferring)